MKKKRTREKAGACVSVLSDMGKYCRGVDAGTGSNAEQ